MNSKTPQKSAFKIQLEKLVPTRTAPEKENKERVKTAAASFLHAISSHIPKNTDWIPDWQDASSYRLDLLKTEQSQWAWEFLRRNRYFQRYCDHAALVDDEDDQEWRIKWGLANYTHYKSSYRSASTNAKGHKLPPSILWGITQPARIIDRTVGPLRHPGVRTIDLNEGQIAVIFDLNERLINPSFIKAQLSHVQAILNKAVRRQNTENLSRCINHQSANLLTYLRVADALSGPNPASRATIGNVLGNEKLLLTTADLSERSEGEFSRAVQYPISVAYKLIYAQGYLNLLAE